MLSVTDPRAVQHVLVDKVYDWPKPEGARQWFLQLLGAGLLYVEGANLSEWRVPASETITGEEAHQRQRHAISPALTYVSSLSQSQPSSETSTSSPQAIRGLAPGFFRMASKVSDNWDAQIQAAPGDWKDIDVMFWANRLSLDTIGTCLNMPPTHNANRTLPGLIGFSYDFQSCAGEALHPVAEALERLTNSSSSFSAFVMKGTSCARCCIRSSISSRPQHWFGNSLPSSVCRPRRVNTSCATARRSATSHPTYGNKQPKAATRATTRHCSAV